MFSVRRRLGAGFAALVLLFLAVVLVQVLVGDRLQQRAQQHTERLQQARSANQAALQHMTDAETGVRGFQLTGDRRFLEPYDDGRAGAFVSFDLVAERTTDPQVRRLLSAERQSAGHWMYAYAIPIVNAGVAGADEKRAARGKELFDRLRVANAEVDAAIHAEQVTVARADRRRARLAQVLFAGLAALFLVVASALAAMHQRQLLGPLEHIRLTLQRLAAGERWVRATPAGPGEMRAVIGTLNDLAARTERLHDAEQARAQRNELRQAVAAELRDERRPVTTARRIAALIGTALGADAVHGRVTVEAGTGVQVRWPADAASLSPRTVADVLAATPGTVLTVPHTAGAIAVPLDGDTECPPGLIYVVRRDRPDWSAEERRLLAALAREIDHAVRRQRLQLRQARLIGELRRLDEHKDAFVATVTHELRTPLTSILGYTEALADGDGGTLSGMQRRAVDAIVRNALRLRDTVADLQLLDRSARVALAASEPVDLSGVAAAARAELEPVARAKGLTLLVDESGPAPVRGDAGRLARALRNLLDNAVKFTPAGGRITWRVSPGPDSVTVTVTDTGIGIPADDLPGLFVPFHRAANALDQAVQGSGLGLAIARTIVGEHGGTVTVSSQLDRGSTFTVTLPAAGAQASTPGTTPELSRAADPAAPARSGRR